MTHKVFLVEGSKAVSAALHDIIESEPDFELIGETDRASELLALIGESHPDIILLSHAMLGLHLLDMLDTLASRFPSAKVLVLSFDNDSRFAVRVFAAGASGYMLKDRANEELIDAIRTIAFNRTYLSPGVAGMGRVRREGSASAKGVSPERENVFLNRTRLSKRNRVLVVDDEKPIRETFRHTFEHVGYTVVTASTAEEAIEAARGEMPDIAFVDLVMPGAGGVQVIRALREMDEALPVVIVTGYPDSALMHQALAYSPLLVLAKPVGPKALLDTARSALAGWRGVSSRSERLA